jgi:WD40 repeat protein
LKPRESPEIPRKTSEFAEQSKKHGLHVNYQSAPNTNPYKRWSIQSAPNYPVGILSVEYSPFSPVIAAVSCSDGKLRLIEVDTDRAITTVSSYFGSFLCSSWSSNGKYLLSGSEDDLVSLWQWDRKNEKLKLLGRGEGHNSYVSAVAFDEHHSSDALLRFGSVAEDGKLILWEYSVAAALLAHSNETTLESNGVVFSQNSSMHPGKVDPLDINSFVEVSSPKNAQRVPTASMKKVPKLEVVVTHHAHSEPCSSLQFCRGGIVTASWGAHIKYWKYSNFG